MQSNINVDVSGGTKRLKYFVSGGYFSQGGLVRNFAKADDDVNTGYFYRRFDYRTNLDFTVTDNLTMRLDFSSRFMNINEPSSLNATGEIYNFGTGTQSGRIVCLSFRCGRLRTYIECTFG